MNARQESKLNMYQGVQLLCKNNSTITNTNIAFTEALNVLDLNITEIQSYATLAIKHTKGISTDKNLVKANLCLVASKVAGFIFAYASTVNNTVLMEEANYPLNTLKKLREDVIVPTVNNIYQVANANLNVLANYGINQASLDELSHAIADYNKIVPITKTKSSERANFTDNIAKLIEETDTLLKNRLDKLILLFEATHPDFVNTYKKVRHVDAPNKTITQIKGKVSNKVDGKAIEGAIITLIGTTSTTTKSDKEGNFMFKPASYGDYQLSIKATGFKDYIDNAFVVKKGNVNRVLVGLEE